MAKALPIVSDLPERIAAWREHRKLTPGELAKKIGVTAAAVYQWEGTGDSQTVPSTMHLHALVEALDLTMARFYGALPVAKAS